MIQSQNRIKSIITAVNQKTGVKNINLKTAVQLLCDGYSSAATAQAAVTAETGAVPIESGGALANILNAANAKTGQNDPTITAAVQRLCDGYSAPEKLYSFGVLSDLHIQYVTGIADFQRALTYLKDRVPFTCICGDLVAYTTPVGGTVEAYGTTDYMEQYRLTVEQYAGNMPVYECVGNHETYTWTEATGTVGGDLDVELWTDTTDKAVNYTFTHGDDMFIMVGLKSERKNDLFPDGTLDWLKTQLDANTTKRCFIFQHIPEMTDKAADPSQSYSDMLMGTSGQAFVELIKQYPNVVWFHGHTHVTFGAELPPVTDTEVMGYKSVHIPSLVGPRFYNPETNALENYYYDDNGTQIWGSTLAEGYIVDVYENYIVLRGIDFAGGANKDAVSPMADEVYALATEKEEPAYINQIPISTDASGAVYNGTGFKTNTRINSSGADATATGWYATGFIPAKKGDIIRMDNMTFMDLDDSGGDYKRNVFSLYNADKSYSTVSTVYTPSSLPSAAWEPEYGENGDIIKVKIPTSYSNNIAYLRICARSITAESIITINQSIT